MPRARCAVSNASAEPTRVALWWMTMNSHARVGATSAAPASCVVKKRNAATLIFSADHIRCEFSGQQLRDLRFQHDLAVLLRTLGDVTAPVHRRDCLRAAGGRLSVYV